MTAQIIFFLAVALFIVLLLRHFQLLEKGFNLIMKFVRAIRDFVANRAGGFTVKPSFRIPRPSLPKREAPREVAGATAGQDSSDFWREELIHEKQELLTDYEEGEVLFKEGKFEEAEKFFLKAATKNPKDARVYARLGLIYLQNKNYTDATEALKVAVKLDKYNPSRYFNLALAYAGKNDRQRAIATIREAISLDPVSQKYRTLLEQLLNQK